MNQPNPTKAIVFFITVVLLHLPGLLSAASARTINCSAALTDDMNWPPDRFVRQSGEYENRIIQ